MGCCIARCEIDSPEQRLWNAVRRGPSGPPARILRLHLLRGGQGKVCLCPSLYWPDRFSLVCSPQLLPTKLRRPVYCETLSIWNFNNLSLHCDQLPIKTKGTRYDVLLVTLLENMQGLSPRFVEFIGCDLTFVSTEMLHRFVAYAGQERKIEEIYFDDACTNLPFKEGDVVGLGREARSRERGRKLSLAAIDALNLGGVIVPEKLPSLASIDEISETESELEELMRFSVSTPPRQE